MKQQRFIPSLLLTVFTALALSASAAIQGASPQSADSSGKSPATKHKPAAAPEKHNTDTRRSEPDEASQESEDDAEAQYRGWQAKSRLEAAQWVGNWLISRDGEAQHVWSLNGDGSGRSYAFSEQRGKMKFSYGYDIRWYFDPFTQMANIKTERRIVCRDGKIYPYFLTLKSYESDYAVKGKYAWQTTWTEASIGTNTLHKSLVVFVAPLSGWHNPEKDAPCPEFPRLDIEKDIDLALDRWEMEAAREETLVDTTPAQGEPEFDGEDFGPAPDGATSKSRGKPQQHNHSAKARVKDRTAKPADKQASKPRRNHPN